MADLFDMLFRLILWESAAVGDLLAMWSLVGIKWSKKHGSQDLKFEIEKRWGGKAGWGWKENVGEKSLFFFSFHFWFSRFFPPSSCELVGTSEMLKKKVSLTTSSSSEHNVSCTHANEDSLSTSFSTRFVVVVSSRCNELNWNSWGKYEASDGNSVHDSLLHFTLHPAKLTSTTTEENHRIKSSRETNWKLPKFCAYTPRELTKNKKT